MNIFATHFNPVWSAIWLDDLRANKMILESCQLLSTTINLVSPELNLPVYKNFNPNHPCAVWTRSSRKNFSWLLNHTFALLNRGAPTHKSKVIYLECKEWSKDYLWKLPDTDEIIFQNSAANDSLGINYKNVKDVHLAYRLYLNHRWKNDKKPPTWKTGQKPVWYEG